MSYTLSQAAEATDKSRMTIQRAIKKGRISASKDDSGQYQIDPSELHRVYEPVSENDTGNRNILQRDTRNDTSMLQAEVDHLHQLLQERDRRIEDKNEYIEDLRQRLDNESDERRRLSLMITDQTTRKRKGVWTRLFGSS